MEEEVTFVVYEGHEGKEIVAIVEEEGETEYECVSNS
jgi:hypothetical protein